MSTGTEQPKTERVDAHYSKAILETSLLEVTAMFDIYNG
jgi:hypothetical protein